MASSVPEGFKSEFVYCNGVRLHVVHNADMRTNSGQVSDTRPALLMLHGFPEFWIAWRDVFQQLSDDFLIIAPDQRGYNLSDAPAGVEVYRANLLVEDMIELTSQLLGDRKFNVAGHDWGASIAYALAMRLPEKIERLIIANGVHPVCFQEAIINDPKQSEASQYIHILRRDDASRIMAENEYQRTFSMFEKFSSTPWLSDEYKAEYKSAWSQPGRLETMLHWYHSSPIQIPPQGSKENAPLYGASREKFRISMPHLLIWGANDQALLPSTIQDLDAFCDDLTQYVIPEADHWLLHTHSAQIARQISGFLQS